MTGQRERVLSGLWRWQVWQGNSCSGFTLPWLIRVWIIFSQGFIPCLLESIFFFPFQLMFCNCLWLKNKFYSIKEYCEVIHFFLSKIKPLTPFPVIYWQKLRGLERFQISFRIMWRARPMTPSLLSSRPQASLQIHFADLEAFYHTLPASVLFCGKRECQHSEHLHWLHSSSPTWAFFCQAVPWPSWHCSCLGNRSLGEPYRSKACDQRARWQAKVGFETIANEYFGKRSSI